MIDKTMVFCWFWENGCLLYDTSALAAWVQAIGSIGAIYGALRIAQKQIRTAEINTEMQIRTAEINTKQQIQALGSESKNQHDNSLNLLKRQNQEALLRKYDLSAGILGLIIAHYRTIEEEANKGVLSVVVPKGFFDDDIQMIANIPALDLPDSRTINYIFKSKSMLHDIDQSLDTSLIGRIVNRDTLQNEGHPFTRTFRQNYLWAIEGMSYIHANTQRIKMELQEVQSSTI